MEKCTSCGFSSDEDFAECPSCGYSEEAEETTVEEEIVEEEIIEETAIEEEYVEPVPPRQTNLFEYQNCGVPDMVVPSDEASASLKGDRGGSIKVAALCIGVLVIAFVSVFLIKGILLGSGNREPSVSESLAEETDKSKFPVDSQITVKETRYKMTGDFSDYQIKINGMVYQIHMSLGEILDSGWVFTDGVTDGILTAGDKAEISLKSVDGAVMQVTAVNFSDKSISCRDCIVCEIKVDFSENESSEISIIGDLKLGFASVSSLEDMVGKCSDKVAANRGTVLTYTESETRIAQFTFRKETGELIGIRYTDTKKPRGYDDGSDNGEGGSREDLPYPTDPSVTPTSGIVSIDGDVYRLPIDVSLLIERGWTGKFESAGSKIPSGGRAYATFTRGSAVLSGVDVYNPTVSDAYIKDCSIIAVSSTSAEGWVVFPMGIKVGISEAALVLSVEGMEYDFDDTYFDEYVFSEGQYTFVVNVDKKTEKVIYVSSSYNY